MSAKKIINDQVGGTDIVVSWAEGTASALDNRNIADSRDICSTNVFKTTLDGQKLTFEIAGDGTFTDKETGTTWTQLDQGLNGPLAGKQLTPVVHANNFWFAWAVFKPDTRVYQSSHPSPLSCYTLN